MGAHRGLSSSVHLKKQESGFRSQNEELTIAASSAESRFSETLRLFLDRFHCARDGDRAYCLLPKRPLPTAYWKPGPDPPKESSDPPAEADFVSLDRRHTIG